MGERGQQSVLKCCKDPWQMELWDPCWQRRRHLLLSVEGSFQPNAEPDHSERLQGYFHAIFYLRTIGDAGDWDFPCATHVLRYRPMAALPENI